MVGPDAIDAPYVVSIALAPGVIVPAAGYTGATIDVIITLSEAPKAFTAADHLDVTHATAADPVALDPVPEQSLSEIETSFARAGVGNPPRVRELYDVSGDVLFADLPATAADVTDAIRKERADNGGLHRAINEAAILLGKAYTYKRIDPTTGEELDDGTFSTEGVNPATTDTAFATWKLPLVDGDTEDHARVKAITGPSETLTAAETHPMGDDGSGNFGHPTLPDVGDVTFPAGTDRTVKPTLLNPADFETAADYQAGLALFNARRSLYVKYVNEESDL